MLYFRKEKREEKPIIRVVFLLVESNVVSRDSIVDLIDEIKKIAQVIQKRGNSSKKYVRRKGENMKANDDHDY